MCNQHAITSKYLRMQNGLKAVGHDATVRGKISFSVASESSTLQQSGRTCLSAVDHLGVVVTILRELFARVSALEWSLAGERRVALMAIGGRRQAKEPKGGSTLVTQSAPTFCLLSICAGARTFGANPLNVPCRQTPPRRPSGPTTIAAYTTHYTIPTTFSTTPPNCARIKKQMVSTVKPRSLV